MRHYAILLLALSLLLFGGNVFHSLRESTLARNGKSPGLILRRRSGRETRATAFAQSPADCCSPPLQRRGFFVRVVNYAPPAARVLELQTGKTKETNRKSATGSTSPRVSLSPRFSPGQVFRYEMEFETTTATSRSGLATDPQGPAKLVITWDATIRMEVLPPDPAAPGDIRLRITYEKSTANLRSDSFDPAANETRDQYQALEGKVVEFTIDAAGKIKSASGIEGIVSGEKAAQAARDWIAQLNAGTGAPAGGVAVGQKWTSEEAATSLPVAGIAWRTEAAYLRNEPCHPPNPDVPSAASSADPGGNQESSETCAVILTHLDLVRNKSVRDATPEEYRKNGVRTVGNWTGSAQSLTYVSLSTGLVVSVTQTGTEDIDVTMTGAENTSLHYAGTILSRSQVALIADDTRGK
jgi:hypothetical protein